VFEPAEQALLSDPRNGTLWKITRAQKPFLLLTLALMLLVVGPSADTVA